MDGTHRILAPGQLRADDRIIPGEQVHCRATTHDSGLYSFELTDEPTGTTVFRRGDPADDERAASEALAALYQSFQPTGMPDADR
ncbi:MAG: hypothetical protein JOZ47_18970 [Kutzneria sp.]|nr:hypothetical protein [Kutzneria sp.]MBV9847127.1 hypothetical protein [Kutzneria sp.]